MKNSFPSFVAFSTLLSIAMNLQAATGSVSSTEVAPPPLLISSHLNSFTGKITKNKVRLRLQPTYDGAVIRELKRNDLVVVLDETDDFYVIQPPADIYGYVFRTYVLDNVIEGNKVNVRLNPDLDAPVLAQLNSGDRIEGTIDPANNKWLKIKLPSTAHLYIAKEYIEKAGDAGLMARLEKKQEDANRLITTTEAMSKTEMQKSFEQVNIENLKANYQYIISNYPEFPELVTKANELLTALQQAYVTKKLAFLEAQSKQSTVTLENNKKLAEDLQAYKAKLARLEQYIEKNRAPAVAPPAMIVSPPVHKKPSQVPLNMSTWLPLEENLFREWAQKKGGNPSPQDFYEAQKTEAFVLKGIIDPYNRPVKNKPGDYMLVNTASKLPIAFLYSTHVNLQDYIGHEISIVVVPRSNNNYAFPAYFVLSLE